jgi:transcriptional regulator with XRE-family HTH domain
VIGDRVRELREERKWSQERLARFSGVSRKKISKLETGEVKEATLATGAALAEAFGVPVSYLLKESAPGGRE